MLFQKLTVFSAIFALGVLGAPAQDNVVKRGGSANPPPSPTSSTTTPYKGKLTTLTGLARPPLNAAGSAKFQVIGKPTWNEGINGKITATSTSTQKLPTTIAGKKTAVTNIVTVLGEFWLDCERE